MNTKSALIPIAVIALLTLTLSFERCSDNCQVTSRFNYYTPVYTTTAEIKAMAGMQQAREVKNPGRIYIKDNYLFVNEQMVFTSTTTPIWITLLC